MQREIPGEYVVDPRLTKCNVCGVRSYYDNKESGEFFCLNKRCTRYSRVRRVPEWLRHAERVFAEGDSLGQQSSELGRRGLVAFILIAGLLAGLFFITRTAKDDVGTPSGPPGLGVDSTAPPSATPIPTPVRPRPTPTPSLFVVAVPSPVAAELEQRLSESRLAELRLFTLQLINKDRSDHGLSPVALGSNPAAQSHAEDMLVHGYLGHWWVDGRKPYMVYSETGGQSYASENSASRGWTQEEWDKERCGSSLVNCTRSEPKEDIEDLELRMMYNDAHADWGHRDNILGNTHRFVNIGIAWDGRRTVLAQQFEGGDAVANGRPALSADGTLSFRLTKVARDIEVGDLVTVYYDPPPSPKTPAQIDTLDSYCIGGGFTTACDHEPVARILETLGPGFYYPNLDPNEVVADSWSQSSTSFEFTASLGSRATRPGVYTVMVWRDSGSPLFSEFLVALSAVQR